MTTVDKRVLRHESFQKTVPRSYLVVFIILLLFFAVGSYSVYGFFLEHWYSGPARSAAHVLPIPAAIVGGDVVWYKDVAELSHVMQIASEKQGDSLEDAFDTGLHRAVENMHIRHLAASLEVTVSPEEVRDFPIEDENFLPFLDEVGWTETQYRKYIITPLLLAQKTESAVERNATYQADVYETMKNIQHDIEIGLPFDDLAKQFSEDPSATSGGYAGYFRKEDLPEGLASVFSLDVGDVSEILETDGSFVIARPYDVVAFDGEPIQLALQLIARKKESLATVLDVFTESQKVFYLVR